MKRTISYLFFYLFLCSCNNTGSANTAVKLTNPFNESTRPVAISYIQETNFGEEVRSYSLSKDADYTPIAVEKGTYLRGPAGVDSSNNLYLAYGLNENFISKLGLDGSVTTIELPITWHYQSIWAGNKLLILPAGSGNEMYIVDTNLEVKIISPALNILPDGSHGIGFLGYANSTSNLVIWISALPIRNADGNFAFYRTFNLDDVKTTEEMLPIPASNQDFVPSNDSKERLGTIVYGVDIKSKNILLCYGLAQENNRIATTLELFAASDSNVIDQEQRCCLNNRFDLRGDTIIENLAPESCSDCRVRNWS
ncbi:MAG TPA: hypothetical protein PKD55_23150, partial [Bellilinea sp.]|nr:hypothetical protein [Bellilinea sp.]